MKVIKQFEHLTVSGENLYNNADTVIYWNSIDENNIAQIVGGSFVGNTQLDVVVPCCLPDYNKVVICNYVGCQTGTQNYRYVSTPRVDKFLPTQQQWGKEVIVKGKHLEDVTGVFVGDKQVKDYKLPSRNKVIFDMPDRVEEGLITIYTNVGVGSSSEKITGLRPDVEASWYSSPKYYGQSGIIKGQSLDLMNRIALQDFNNQPVIVEGATSFKNLGSTGIKFVLPEGVANDSSVSAQRVTGQFVNGVYQSAVQSQYALGTTLDLKSVYINNFDKDREAYNKQIRLSGVNLHKSKIFFRAANGTYLEGAFVSSGKKYKTVKVPKNIVTSPVLASGIGGEYSGKHYSDSNFYPLPTIIAVDRTKWEMGSQVNLSAVNASGLLATVGMTGINTINNQTGVYFVANGSTVQDTINNFGYFIEDNSLLESDPVNGWTKINMLVNSEMAGQGKPFLLATAEQPEQVNFSNLGAVLKNSYTLNNLSDLTYHSNVEIDSKTTSILGISNPQSAASGQLNITGHYFLPMTGVQLSEIGGNEIKRIPKSSLIYVNGSQIRIVASGNLNNYERPHVISVNVEDFNFQSKNGTFKILTPDKYV